MIKIGVISDTHLTEPVSEFKRAIEYYFKDVDGIFHAGDFIGGEIADYLSGFKELTAVCGNMDSLEIHKNFPQKRIIELEGFKIGLIHGGGPPFGVETRIREEFDDVDAIVYGHTHTPANHSKKNILYFNSGSLIHPSGDRPTLGILSLGETIEGEIVIL